ncbi:hypothetical protein RCIP0097_00047 [Klebsiella phage RCIP0097]
MIAEFLDGNIVASYPARNRSEDKLASLLVVDLPYITALLFDNQERCAFSAELFRATTVVMRDRSFGRSAEGVGNVIGRLVADGLDTFFRRSDDVGKAVRNGNCSHYILTSFWWMRSAT